MHLERLTRTLSVVPEPGTTRRVLELGAYMQMTPVLGCILGYNQVRGAYYGSPGQVDSKVSTVGGREIFRCDIDFDTVLAAPVNRYPSFLYEP
jgi:hypothetical protein